MHLWRTTTSTFAMLEQLDHFKLDKKLIDEKTGKVYYGNTKTGATQWARPE